MDVNKKEFILKGSFTVEAALLVPLVIMMLFALICLMLAARQKADLQARVDIEAEAAVMAGGEDGEEGIKIPQAGDIYNALRSLKRSEKSAQASFVMLHAGIRQLTGGDFQLEAFAAAVRVVYVDDWLKAHAVKRRESDD